MSDRSSGENEPRSLTPPSPTFLVAVATKANHRAARNAIRRTWAASPPAGISVRFFRGGDPDAAGEEADLDCLGRGERDSDAPATVQAFVRLALERFQFDWIFLCHDTTYVALDRLPSLAVPDVGLIGNDFVHRRGEPDPGAGYLISRAFAEFLAEEQGLPESGAESAMIGQAIHGAKLDVRSSKRMGWNHAAPPAADNDRITAHWCSPGRMFAIHAFRESPGGIVFDVKHRFWKDRLSFEADGSFRRILGSCRGTWTRDEDGALLLHWNDWPVERVVPVGSGFHGEHMELRPHGRKTETGRPPRKIPVDLRQFPVVVTSGRRFGVRRERISKMLQREGFPEPSFFLAELEGGSGTCYASITLNHLVAIASQPPPFILLEDDAMPTQWFARRFEIPENADAVWLGITDFGMSRGKPTAGAARLNGERTMPRVANMLGTHAILFLTTAFTAAVRDRLFLLLRQTPGTPHDRILAAMQDDWIIHAPNPPLFFQDDGHLPCVTNSEVEVSDD